MSDVFESLLPRTVTIVCATPDMWHAPLDPLEERCVTRAVQKRRREFTAGRQCARTALALLGIQDFPLVVGADRAPVWPDGITGSITHCGDFCAAAVARSGDVRGLGLDAEEARPLAPELVDLVVTEEERKWIWRWKGNCDAAKLLFSAKESVYKCYGPLHHAFLEFQDVELELDPAAATFIVRPCRDVTGAAELGRIRGRYAVDRQWILTAAFIPAPVPAPPSGAAG